MSLNPSYFIAPSLQEYFVDKITGLPMSGGKVYFYSDVNRASLKPIYTLSGSAPNYTYTQLPNPVILNAVGTFSSNGSDDVLPYYYPYDSSNNLELYYIQVYNSDNVHQFDRQAYPNIAVTTDEGNINLTNYIPNGQFWTHNANYTTTSFNYGTSTATVYNIAPGGWTFERPNTTTSVDTISFARVGSFVASPTSSPRYELNVVCTAPNAGDAYKDLRIKFNDVNKFASDTQQYTFAFTGQSNSGTLNVSINIVKYFGSGGSTTLYTSTGTSFALTSNPQIFSLPIIFGTNAGKTIGSNDDDFVQVTISFPTNASFNATITDAILTPGNVSIATFPTTTNANFIADSIAGWLSTPSYTGLDLYLPLIVTPTGLQADRSQVGKVLADYNTWGTSISSTTNELLCDGSQYFTNNYSTLGIPFSRLQSVLYNSTLSLPIFGTGKNFSTANILNGVTNGIFFSNNQFGSGVAPADSGGGTATGFTFTAVHAESSTGYNVLGFSQTSTQILVSGNVIGTVTAPTAGNSGFNAPVVYKNISTSYAEFSITAKAASTITAGHYWTFSNTTTTYYMWFKINGAGSDPAPGGTGILVNLLSTYTAADVANAICCALNGGPQSEIDTVAGSSVVAGSYWTFTTANGTAYYVWYKVSGSGSDPAPSNKTGILVNVLSGDTNVQVATKTITAINSFCYAVPDLRGVALRGYDPTVEWDTDAATRFGLSGYGVFGNALGTYELDQIVSHTHTFTVPTTATGYTTGSTTSAFVTPAGGGTTAATGGSETRMVNANVNWVIKY